MITFNNSVRLSFGSGDLNQLIVLNQSQHTTSNRDVPEDEDDFMVLDDEGDTYARYLNNDLDDAMARNTFHIVIFAIGLAGSLLSAFVFSRQKMASSVFTLMGALEIANGFVYYSFFPGLVRSHFPSFVSSRESVTLFKATVYVQVASIFMSNWTTVLVAFWRYANLLWPARAYNWCSRSRSHISLALIFACSIILAVPSSVLFSEQEVKFFAYERNSQTYYSTSIYRPILSDWAASNDGCLLTFHRIVMLCTTTVPFTYLTGFTFFTVGALWDAKRKRQGLFNLEDLSKFSNARILLLLISVVVVYAKFLLCFVGDSFGNAVALAVSYNKPKIGEQNLVLFKDLNMFLVANSLNFFLNYTLCEEFRKAFLDLWCFSLFRRGSKSSKNSSETHTSSNEVDNFTDLPTV